MDYNILVEREMIKAILILTTVILICQYALIIELSSNIKTKKSFWLLMIPFIIWFYFIYLFFLVIFEEVICKLPAKLQKLNTWYKSLK